MSEGSGAGETPHDLTLDGFLEGQLVLAQPRSGYRAGLDAMLLASTVAGNALSRVLDMGAGVGAVGLAVALRLPELHVTLVEIEPAMAQIARANILRNGLVDRATVVCGDATRPHDGLAQEAFDVVLMNPPYQIVGEGRPASIPQKARAHAMPEGALDDWLRAAARLCRPGGHVHLIHRVDALWDILHGLDRRFGAIQILPVAPKSGEPAKRLVVVAKKGSHAGIKLLAPLVLHAADGELFPGVDALLRGKSVLNLETPSLFEACDTR